MENGHIVLHLKNEKIFCQAESYIGLIKIENDMMDDLNGH